MKTILIVDSNKQTVNMLNRAFNAYSDLLKVSTANDGQVAMDLIKGQKIDLVITELHLPNINGISIIKSLLNNSKKNPIVVLTAYGTPEIEAKLKSIPTIQYFSKPAKIDAVIESVFNQLKIPFGQVDGVGLSSFMQLLQMEAKTCTLCVISKKNEIGTLYFLDGALIAAESEKNKNEEAAYEILKWKDVKIHIVNSAFKGDQQITQSLMNILMEGAKLEDEDDSTEEPEQSAPQEEDQPGVESLYPEDTIDQPVDSSTLLDDGAGGERITGEQLMQSGPMAEPLVKMKEALTKVMGPIAEHVFMESLNIWAEFIEPSRVSLPSLIDILDQEIGDPEKIVQYRSLIEEYI